MTNPWDLPELEAVLDALKTEAEIDRFLRGRREKAPAPTEAILRFNALLETIKSLSRPDGKVFADLPPPLPAQRLHIWADLYFPLLRARVALAVLVAERRNWRRTLFPDLFVTPVISPPQNSPPDAR